MAELEPGVLERCDTCHRPIRDEALCWYIGDEAEGTRYPYCERCSVHAEAAWRIECEMRVAIEAQQPGDPAGLGALMGEMDWRVEGQMIREKQEESCQLR